MKTLVFVSIFSLGCCLSVFAQPLIDSILIEGVRNSNPSNPLLLGVAQDRLELFFTPDTTGFTKYIFFLEGFDKDTLRYQHPIATYTNLKGGDYTFWYYTYKNNIYSAHHAIKIHINPSLLELWWFWPSLAFYLLLLVLAAAYFVMINNSRGKATLQAMRNQIARDLHDEVGTTLSGIGMAVGRVQRSTHLIPTDAVTTMETIKTDIRIVIDKLRDAVWAITPDSDDDFHTLIDKLYDFAAPILENKNIDFDFKNQIKPEDKVKLRMEQRHNVHLILKEAVNNIVKHSEANAAYLHIQRNKEGIQIEVGDNGKGFDTLQVNNGNGLKNFQKRAEDSFADLIIKSELGKGTQLSILVPEI